VIQERLAIGELPHNPNPDAFAGIALNNILRNNHGASEQLLALVRSAYSPNIFEGRDVAGRRVLEFILLRLAEPDFENLRGMLECNDSILCNLAYFASLSGLSREEISKVFKSYSSLRTLKVANISADGRFGGIRSLMFSEPRLSLTSLNTEPSSVSLHIETSGARSPLGEGKAEDLSVLHPTFEKGKSGLEEKTPLIGADTNILGSVRRSVVPAERGPLRLRLSGAEAPLVIPNQPLTPSFSSKVFNIIMSAPFLLTTIAGIGAGTFVLLVFPNSNFSRAVVDMVKRATNLFYLLLAGKGFTTGVRAYRTVSKLPLKRVSFWLLTLIKKKK
jgi:hypothetical protein